jgi:hypothetical protein
MSTAVESVYELRQLLARCQSPAGLDMAEIEAMVALEAEFAGPGTQVRAVDLVARVRSGSNEDRVQLVAVGPSAMALTGAPYLDDGALVELLIDDDGAGHSYRFKGRVAALDDDEGDLYRARIELIGAPLLLRKPLRTIEMPAAAEAA